MKFIVRLNDKEEGPIDEETLEKWVEIDKVFPDTPVRNVLIKDWKKAHDFDFLTPLLEKQKERLEAKKGIFDHLKESLQKNKNKTEEKSTAFKYQYLPDPAPFILRFCAFLFDMIPIGICFLILFSIGTYMVHRKALELCPPLVAEESVETAPRNVIQEPKSIKEAQAGAVNNKQSEEKKITRADNLNAERPPSSADDITKNYILGSKWIDITTDKEYYCLSGEEKRALWIDKEFVNSTFYLLFTVFFIFVLLYYSLTIGLFAQTFGMWFWGIFVTKPNLEEVYFFRAYVFSILLIFTGFLTPLFVYLNPLKRSIHELLSGTMVIRISAKPKA